MTNTTTAQAPFVPVISKQRFSEIFKLGSPIILGMASQTILNLVDMGMVGRLGTVPLAAVGICSILIWGMTSLIQGISPAVQSTTARRLGENREDRLHEAIVNAFYLIVVFSVPYTWILLRITPSLFHMLTDDPAVHEVGVAYTNIRLYTVVLMGLNFCFRGHFNGRKRSILYMQTLLIMHAVNLVLNYLLIFGKFGFPQMGASGAALGTAIATATGTCIYLTLLLANRTPQFSFSLQVISGSILKNLLKLAIPSCFQSFTMAAGFLLFFRIAGMISTEAVAATNVLVNMGLACVLFSMGLGIATITLVGNSIGKNDPDDAKAWVKSTLVIACSTLGLVGLGMALLPEFLLSLFMTERDALKITIAPLILVGLSQSFDAAAVILSHALLGGGDSKRVMLISVANQWILFLPCCFIWVYFFNGGLLHIWICYVSYRFLLFISALLVIRSGHWLKISF